MTEFLNPRTLEEALDALAADGDDLRVVSGATDVVVWVRDGRMGVSRYLNLSYLGGELRFIREEDGFIEIGALTTLTDLLRSDLIRRHGLALREAAALFGSVQIRNRATVAGKPGNGLAGRGHPASPARPRRAGRPREQQRRPRRIPREVYVRAGTNGPQLR